MKHRLALVATASLLSLTTLTSCSGSDSNSGNDTPYLTVPTAQVDATLAQLRTDSDGDGAVDAEGAPSNAGQAVFLPNLDDDGGRCTVPSTKSASGKKVSQKAFVVASMCSDASDKVVNGDEDANDLAPIESVARPDLPDDATGSLAVTAGADKVHLFLKDGSGWQLVTDKTRFSADQLREGVTLGLEGRDIVRDPEKWDGSASIDLTVTAGAKTGTDTVTLRVAPMRSTNHLMPAEQVLVSSENLLAKGKLDPAYTAFNKTLAEQANAAGVPEGVRVLKDYPATFLQDAFEQMYVTLPTPEGEQAINLVLVSGEPRTSDASLQQLRGPGTGMLWAGEGVGTSGGNFETIPPYAHNGTDFPQGRPVIGLRKSLTDKTKPEGEADKKRLITLLEAQGAKPLTLDVGWLAVGHVDEFLQFLPADTERGWRIAVADPELALDVLRQDQEDRAGSSRVSSHGSVTGKSKLYDEINPTIDSALKPGSAILKDNAIAAEKIAANLEILKKETGLTDEEIVRVPALYRHSPEPGHPMVGVVPAAVNNLLAAPDTVIVAKQFGVEVEGRDVLSDAVEQAYADADIRVLWIDDFTTHHVGGGDVHCATNVFRIVN